MTEMYMTAITFEDIVEEKISLLYDFHYLRHKKDSYHDPREEQVRQMLLACGNENRINSAIRGIHIGDYTLNELLKMKGFAI